MSCFGISFSFGGKKSLGQACYHCWMDINENSGFFWKVAMHRQTKTVHYLMACLPVKAMTAVLYLRQNDTHQNSKHHDSAHALRIHRILNKVPVIDQHVPSCMTVFA